MIGVGMGRIAQPLSRVRTQRPGWSGPAPVRHVNDRQHDAIAERDRERARRALWALCERRPLEFDR